MFHGSSIRISNYSSWYLLRSNVYLEYEQTSAICQWNELREQKRRKHGDISAFFVKLDTVHRQAIKMTKKNVRKTIITQINRYGCNNCSCT